MEEEEQSTGMGFVLPHADHCSLPLYDWPAAPATAASGSGRTVNDVAFAGERPPCLLGDEVDLFAAHLQQLTADADRLLQQHVSDSRD